MYRELNADITVSGQIETSDIPDLKAAGFSVIVDGRPDAEIPPTHHSSAMLAEAEKAGLAFHYIPMTPGTIPSEDEANGFLQATGGGKVFAYCGGGPRVIVLASFAAATAGKSVEVILSEARALGMDLSSVRQLLVERGAAEA